VQFPQNRRFRHPAIVELENAVGVAPVGHILVTGPHFEAWMSHVDQKRRHLLARAVRGRLLAGGGPLHGSLAHDVVPERRERREKGEIERRIPARGGVEILRKALPVPRDARIEHLENELRFDQVDPIPLRAAEARRPSAS